MKWILFLAALPLFAADDLDALWKDACQWNVGSAQASVKMAREKLVANGAATLDYLIPAKLDTMDGLVIDAIQNVVTRIKEGAAERLLPCLKSEKPNVRRNAASLLGQVGAKEAAPEIAKLLTDADARLGALTALAQLKAVETVPRVVELMRSKVPERLQVTCAATLGALGGEEAEKALLAELSAKAAPLRFAAQFALEKMKAVAPLRERLKGDDRRVRLHAIAALGHIGDAAAHDDLAALLADPDAVVRGFAAEALGAMLRPEDKEALRARLAEEKDPFARGKLEEALAK